MDSRRSQTRKTKDMDNKPSFVVRMGIAMALAFAIWTPLQAQPAAPPRAKSMMPAMAEKCQQMKLEKQKMRDEMKAQDARLTAELATMNRAPEGQKVALMATALTHLVEQRVAMDARRAEMEEGMMQHMMEHMQMGKETMSDCPMMGGMKGMSGMKGMRGKSGSAVEGQKGAQK